MPPVTALPFWGEVSLVVGDNVALAIVDTEDGEFKGEAKRAPGDPRNQYIARDLALGRCLQKYGAFLEARGLRLSGTVSSGSTSQHDG